MTYPTWSDLNKESIVPPLGAGRTPDIGSVAVMISCGPDIKFIQHGRPDLKKVPFFMSTLMTPSGGDKGISIAGPFIGAPYAAMLLESLIAKGADTIIVLGWCGALTDQFSVGDILVPERAVVDEGTSRNYKMLDTQQPCSCPDLKLTGQLMDHLVKRGLEFKKTTVWTTDAIYRETEAKIKYFKDQGASAVEMECSALFSIARYRKIKLTGLLVVSDSVASKKWEPGFRKKYFKQARQNACTAVMAFAGKMNKNG